MVNFLVQPTVHLFSTQNLPLFDSRLTALKLIANERGHFVYLDQCGGYEERGVTGKEYVSSP